MYLYRTIYKEAQAEQVINRSRFITYVSPIETYEEAQAFVAMIKEKHRDATHNVPAIVYGNKQEIQWMSDDGEPQGTSGPPILKMLVDEGLTNLVVVVTRYFGGVKLGTGGLVRAYSSSAKLGIEAAGICEVSESITMSYTIDYSHLAKLQNLAKDGKFVLDNLEYTDKIILDVICEIENESFVKSMMNDLTAGTCILNSSEKGKIKIKK